MNIIIPDHAIHRAELRMKTPDMEMSEEEKLVEQHKEKFPDQHYIVYSHWTDAVLCLKQRVFITPKCLGEFNYSHEGLTPCCNYCDERNTAILEEFKHDLADLDWLMENGPFAPNKNHSWHDKVVEE
mgnify:FL=1